MLMLILCDKNQALKLLRILSMQLTSSSYIHAGNYLIFVLVWPFFAFH